MPLKPSVEPIKYAGIGSRQTPRDVLNVMCQTARDLALVDATLRTGGAEGADRAFVMGAEGDLESGPVGMVEIYLPWLAYNEWDKRGRARWIFPDPKPVAFEIAAKFHPAWSRLKHPGKRLHARNAHIVLGWNLDDPVDFIACWTPGGKITGGTGQALRMAQHYNIPVVNFGG